MRVYFLFLTCFVPSLQEDCEIFVHVSFVGDNNSCIELSLVGNSESGSAQCCKGSGHEDCQVLISGKFQGIMNSSDEVDLKGNLLLLLQLAATILPMCGQWHLHPMHYINALCET